MDEQYPAGDGVERACSERFVNGEWCQYMRNPATGEWEYLSHRSWRLLKLGVPKEKNKLFNDWQIAMLEGPERACAFAFDLRSDKHEATIKWLSLEYKKFNIKTPQQLYSWSQFMMDVHPIHKYHVPLSKALEIQKAKKCLLTSLMAEAAASLEKPKKSRRKRS